MKHKPEIGDWIRFYNPDRVLVISEVRYIDKQEFPYDTTYSTDIQTVTRENIFEVRKPNK